MVITESHKKKNTLSPKCRFIPHPLVQCSNVHLQDRILLRTTWHKAQPCLKTLEPVNVLGGTVVKTVWTLQSMPIWSESQSTLPVLFLNVMRERSCSKFHTSGLIRKRHPVTQKTCTLSQVIKAVRFGSRLMASLRGEDLDLSSNIWVHLREASCHTENWHPRWGYKSSQIWQQINGAHKWRQNKAGLNQWWGLLHLQADLMRGQQRSSSSSPSNGAKFMYLNNCIKSPFAWDEHPHNPLMYSHKMK